LTTSVCGAGPLGGVACGSFESGPLVGVVGVALEADACASVEDEELELFELEEPHAAIAASTPTAPATIASRDF
jgi:hypothetical protein